MGSGRFANLTTAAGIPQAPQYRGEPAIVRGADKAIPETREDVLSSIIDRLTAKDAPAAITQNYSNGEFISSSLIVGLTAAAVANRSLEHECAGYTIHFDAALGLFWRTGGSSD